MPNIEKNQVMEETLKLYAEIEKGFCSGEEDGWIDKDAADSIIGEMIKKYE